MLRAVSRPFIKGGRGFMSIISNSNIDNNMNKLEKARGMICLAGIIRH